LNCNQCFFLEYPWAWGVYKPTGTYMYKCPLCCRLSTIKPGFHMVKRLSHNLSHQPKCNILELKICRVIITSEYL
jgi:hypothetical protein